MVFGLKSLKNNIKVNREEVETVYQFIYLESLLSAGGCERIKRRIALAQALKSDACPRVWLALGLAKTIPPESF